MHLHWLKPLLGRTPPFTTVHLDASPAELAGESGPVERWRSVRRDLERAGVPTSLLDEIADRVARPDGRRDPHGRVIVADADGVVVDRVMRTAPVTSCGSHGPVPDLAPVVRATDESLHVLVVVADRTGADLRWGEAAEGDYQGPVTETVEGGHDDVQKFHEGGMERRGQTRAEDSWQRNAEAVAAVVVKRVRDKKPDVVILTGDVRAVPLVRDALDQPTRALVVEVQGGDRKDFSRNSVFAQRAAEVINAHRARRREAQVERYREGRGRGDGAVSGLADVVEVLRRGQVDELVVSAAVLDGALGERTLWTGREPLQLALTRSELTAIGVIDGDAREMPAESAVLRAVVGQDAGLTILEEGEADLVDGVGAVLRWADESTPSEMAPTQWDDRRRLRVGA